MAENMYLEQAKTVYQTLCQALDARKWRYQKNEAELTIEGGAQGEDLPMPIFIRVDPSLALITLLSHMPFPTPEEKRLEMAAGVSVVNFRLVDGSFDYNVKTGNLVFRMTTSFRESIVGAEVFNHMIGLSLFTVDRYNDKFLMLAKGLVTLGQFIQDVNK